MNTTSIPRDAQRRLLQLREEYADRLQRLERDRRRAGGALSARFSEQAAEQENDEVVDALALGTRDALAQVEHALQRAEAGAWGICERCGKAIDAPRLRQLPQATRCSRCADAD